MKFIIHENGKEIEIEVDSPEETDSIINNYIFRDANESKKNNLHKKSIFKRNFKKK
jgi:hypothetical protein